MNPRTNTLPAAVGKVIAGSYIATIDVCRCRESMIEKTFGLEYVWVGVTLRVTMNRPD
jgi:hypothetical protein